MPTWGRNRPQKSYVLRIRPGATSEGLVGLLSKDLPTCKWRRDAKKSWISPNPTLASSISCSADKRTSCSKPSMATLLSNPPWHKRDCLQDNMKTPTHHVIKIDNWAMGHHKTQKKQHDKLNKFRLSSNLAQSKQRFNFKTRKFSPYSFKTLLSFKIFH